MRASTFFKLGCTLGMAVGVMIGVVKFAEWIGVPPEQLHGPTFVFTPLNVALVIAVLLSPLLVLWGVNRIGFGVSLTRLFSEVGAARMGAIGLFLGVSVQAANFGLRAILARGATVESILPNEVSAFAFLPFLLWFLFSLVVNSITEEAVFRAFPLTVLVRQAIRTSAAIALLSVLFSLIHFLTSEASLSNLVFRTLYGILLSQFYLMTGSFWLIVGFHTGTNLLSSVFSDPWRMGGVWTIHWKELTPLAESSFSIVLAFCVLGTFWVWRSKGFTLGKNFGAPDGKRLSEFGAVRRTS